jgi:glycosyltransferase involved in cell wall biosynthesis
LAEFGVTGVGVLQTCRELNLPLVVHFHGYDAYLRRLLDRYGAAYRNLFAYAHGIIAVSTQMIDQLVQLGAPRQKVFYNPYGVDVAKFKPARLTSRPQALAVGRFVQKKAPYLTILAFQKVLERLPDATLIMVGDGQLQDVCRQLVRSLHLEHAVALQGAVDHEQVVHLMQDSRIFVQHSLVPQSGDSEGTPVGIPMHAGIVDTVIHGRTGFLVKERDIDAMADYMFQLLTNPELALEMGKRAREHISQNFNIEKSISNLRAVVDKCTGGELAPQPAQLSAVQGA